jgi:hypothetical protein
LSFSKNRWGSRWNFCIKQFKFLNVCNLILENTQLNRWMDWHTIIVNLQYITKILRENRFSLDMCKMRVHFLRDNEMNYENITQITRMIFFFPLIGLLLQSLDQLRPHRSLDLLAHRPVLFHQDNKSQVQNPNQRRRKRVVGRLKSVLFDFAFL